MKRLFSFLVVIALLFSLSIAAHADSLDVTRDGSVTVSMHFGAIPVPGGNVVLYRVGEVQFVDGNPVYVPTGDFSGCVGSFDEFNIHSAELALTLSNYANLNSIIPVDNKTIDNQGVARFDDLVLGVYLLVQPVAAEGYYPISPVLVTVPANSNGVYQYDVLVDSKVPIYPVIPPPTDPVYPDDPGKDDPEEPRGDEDLVDVDDPDDSEEPEVTDEPELPQTGQLNWPVPMMAIAGLLIFAFGWSLRFGQKRDSYES